LGSTWPFAETKRPRAGPPIRAYSLEPGKSPFDGDCVVADAVVFEPVAAIEFLLTGKLTGKIAKFGCDVAPPSSLNAVTTGLFGEIPYEN
jgi:hypothetical protein